MNPKDAIEKLKEKQTQMVAEAEAMAMRADKLQRIVEFQNNPYDGWEVVGLVIQDMQAKNIVLKHMESGIIIHSESNISLEIHDDNGKPVRVGDYIGGGEEE
jgi:hypothetical protein